MGIEILSVVGLAGRFQTGKNTLLVFYLYFPKKQMLARIICLWLLLGSSFLVALNLKICPTGSVPS